MKYYFISIGFSHFKYPNVISTVETTLGDYKDFKNYTKGAVLDWDLSSSEGTGYIIGVATDDDLELINETIINKAFNFLKQIIETKKKKIEELNSAINRIQEHPLYKSINRENQINEILN